MKARLCSIGEASKCISQWKESWSLLETSYSSPISNQQSAFSISLGDGGGVGVAQAVAPCLP